MKIHGYRGLVYFVVVISAVFLHWFGQSGIAMALALLYSLYIVIRNYFQRRHLKYTLNRMRFLLDQDDAAIEEFKRKIR